VKRQEGQTLVEFALVLPLLALILISILQFGVLFNNYLTLTDAVRAGARKAAVSRHDVNRDADVVATVQTAATALTQADLKVTVDSPTWGSGDQVTVKGSYKCDLTILGIDLKPNCHITSQTTERVE
jgi:Flp pilus assembly protein TadG